MRDNSKAALRVTDDFPIRHVGDVHSGKVRSVYWLTDADSERLVTNEQYPVPQGSQLGVMITSDRISAFDVVWSGQDGLLGVPGKGACLNAASEHWFRELGKDRLAGNHILAVPHPLVWIVQRAKPIMVEAVARAYITGSMWRDYRAGTREFCGHLLPDGLKQHQKLDELLLTPTTKGVLRGIPGVPEADDANITMPQIEDNYAAFGFKSAEDVQIAARLVRHAFKLIERRAGLAGQIFVDTKFELGYADRLDCQGRLTPSRMIYIDEVGTLDSSRFWDAKQYARGEVVENSKEGFRQFLLTTFDPALFTDKSRMPERRVVAANYRVPVKELMDVSQVYRDTTRQLTGREVKVPESPREEIISSLSGLGLIE